MVVYLTLQELYDALCGKHTLTQIAELTRRREQARPQAMNIWRGQWHAKKSTPNYAILKGLSGSSGFAMGTVKVISGPIEFDKLKSGDVLVCPYTDPAWTPLFTLACAVVSDTGGPLSHAAIVAREYGIPTVLNIPMATRRIPDGSAITLDGGAGTVQVSGP